MLNPVVRRARPMDSITSAIDCADDEHHRIMQEMQDKQDKVNRKHKYISGIVRQRKRDEVDEASHKKRKNIQQFLLTSNQFTQQWDKRILEETQTTVESIHANEFIDTS